MVKYTWNIGGVDYEYERTSGELDTWDNVNRARAVQEILAEVEWMHGNDGEAALPTQEEIEEIADVYLGMQDNDDEMADLLDRLRQAAIERVLERRG